MLPTNPKTNPIFQRLTRHSIMSLTLRQLAWLAGGLGGVALILILSRFFIDLNTGTIWSVLYLLITELPYPVTVALYSLISLFGAVVAASIAGRDSGTDLYRLMRLTPVTRTDIVWGYIFSTFYRLRVWLALMIALIPVLMLGNISIWAGDILFLLRGLSTYLTQTIGEWGVFFLGVVVGVSEGLLHKKVFPGVIAALLLVILFWAATLVVCGRLSVAYLLFTSSTTSAAYRFFGLSLSRIVLCCSLSLLFFRLASRWA
jgi:hypothetical protein